MAASFAYLTLSSVGRAIKKQFPGAEVSELGFRSDPRGSDIVRHVFPDYFEKEESIKFSYDAKGQAVDLKRKLAPLKNLKLYVIEINNAVILTLPNELDGLMILIDCDVSQLALEEQNMLPRTIEGGSIYHRMGGI